MFSAVIIGLGSIGMMLDFNLDADKYAYTHARALQGHPEFELSASVELQSDLREKFASTYGRPVYSDVASCLAEHSPDLVVISVPTSRHLAVLEEVLAHCRPSAILCEKPLAYSVQEAEQIVFLCQSSGASLFVNYMRRADPAVHEIKRMIEKSQIERPVKGIVWYSKGLKNNGSHFLDLLAFWFGKVRDHQIVSQGQASNEDIEPDVIIRFDNGQFYFLATDENHFSHYGIELLCPTGRLRYDLGGESVQWQPAQRSATLSGYKKLKPDSLTIESGLNQIQRSLLGELSKALKNEEFCICTGEQALENSRTLAVIEDAINGHH